MPLSSPAPDASVIDDYANNMFRFEQLHDGWIDRCAKYLQHIFGDELTGKTVIDYAFGRGNWSVAFLRAGAAKVIAIDASASNAERFGNYCEAHKLSDIEVLCANVLDTPVARTGDILWLYGILPAIADQPRFITAVTKLVPANDALIFAYGYDKGSVREWVVEKSRSLLSYDNESAFRADSLKFTPAGRMRARDDLTAPHVNWHSPAEMEQLFAPLGWNAIKQVDDFRIMDSGYSAAEFDPVHLLFSHKAPARLDLGATTKPYASDLEILTALWNALIPHLSLAESKDLAITVFNTHFSHVTANGEVEQSLLQLYLLLMYGLHAHNVNPASLRGLASEAFALGKAAMSDHSRPDTSHKKDAFLMKYLSVHTIRI